MLIVHQKCNLCGKRKRDVEEIEEGVFLCLDCRDE